MADALGIGCLGGLEHVEVVRFGEDHTFGLLPPHLEHAADHLVVESHKVTQLVVVSLPIGDGLACHT